MSGRFYVAEGAPERTADEIPPSLFARHRSAAPYRPDPGLADAVDVAIELGQPLLLTGEPGTGKTALAGHVASQLGLGVPLAFFAKSTSIARDILYRFDAVARLRAEGQAAVDPRRFIQFNALGTAILHANRPEVVAHVVPEGMPAWEPARSVVLIDEIDKAPRDFPNDLLHELESLSFQVPEVSETPVVADESFRPIVVITSNLERQLPDAFLRRCIYYHIDFPERERLADIVLSRLKPGSVTGSAYLNELLDFFFDLRNEDPGLHKRPATAELLGWLEFLNHRLPADGGGPLANPGVLKASLSVLVKAPEDRTRAIQILDAWLGA
jgi:MoxR-like ATPase